MSILGDNVDAAIRASDKTADEIARVLDVNVNTISRLRTGKEDNPKLQLLLGIARNQHHRRRTARAADGHRPRG